jgi:hypothetical protein
MPRWIAVSCVVALTVLAGCSRRTVASSPARPPAEAEAKERQEQILGDEVVASAKRAVLRLLRDPESAQFRDVFVKRTSTIGTVACGEVNSKNGFGGYVGFKHFVSAGGSVVMEDQHDDSAMVWRVACLDLKPTGTRPPKAALYGLRGPKDLRRAASTGDDVQDAINSVREALRIPITP